MWILTGKDNNNFYKFCNELPRVNWYFKEYMLAKLFVDLETEKAWNFIEEVDAYDYVNKSGHFIKGRTKDDVKEWIMMMINQNKEHLEKRYIAKNITIDTSQCGIKTDKEFFKLVSEFVDKREEDKSLLDKLLEYADFRFPYFYWFIF